MKYLFPIANWLVTLITPFFLLIVAVYFLMGPTFLEFEYHQADFPSDTYGFSTADRLNYSKVAVEYLVNSADISYLGKETFADGSALYQSQELSHMEDVKTVVQKTFTAWWGLLVVLMGVGIWAWRIHWLSSYFKSLSRGGWLTIGLLLLAAVFVMTSFYDLFTWFHELFFKEGSWMFSYSDTLIRLFPLRFWQDAFIIAGLMAIAGGLVFGLGGWLLSKKVD
jgi:integral membrane protein (TIGR01906 family)